MDTGKRIKVSVDVAGSVMVYQRIMQDQHIIQGWRKILDVDFGAWQQVLDALTIHSILPHEFNSAYNYDSGDSERQWGVLTTYTDGSGGIEWSNEDDAKSFLVHYAEADVDPIMRVANRELVRRRVVPRAVQVVPWRYQRLREEEEQRRTRRRTANKGGET